MKVAYLLHRFPTLTETFILRELAYMRSHCEEVMIFSLMPAKRGPVHEQAKEWLPFTQYSRAISWDVISANVRFFLRSPRRYLVAVVKTVRQTFREVPVLMAALFLFPKSVYFAGQMEVLKIDHIHAHFVWLGGISAGIVGELLDIPFTIHAHAFDIFERNQGNVRQELEGATAGVTISNYHRAYISKLCPKIKTEDIRIVHLGVDTDRFQPPAKPSVNNSIQILSIGRLMEKKGHEYLIDACKIMAERGIEFQCKIVGDGPRHAALQQRIDGHGLQGKVVLCGPLEQNQVLELYQNSTIFVLAAVVAQSGDQDGMPYVLIEAMACGLPVITTSLSGIPDLVSDGVTGIFVEQRDVNGLAAAIERLESDESLRLQLGGNARQKILQEFQIQCNVAKLAAIFQSVSRRGQGHIPSLAPTSHGR